MVQSQGQMLELEDPVCPSNPWITFLTRQAPAEPATVMAGTLVKEGYCADFKCLKMYWIYGIFMASMVFHIMRHYIRKCGIYSTV